MIMVRGAVDVAELDPTHADAGVAAHYGDPVREQRILATEVGLVDRSHRTIITVAGDQRLAWLHHLTSQYLVGLEPLTGTATLILSPRGHIEEHLGVFDDGTTTWLDGEPGRGDPLLAFFSAMVFRTRVTLDNRCGTMAMLSLVGPVTAEAVGRLGVGSLPEPGILLARSSSRFAVARIPGWDEAFVRMAQGGADLFVPREAVGDVVSTLGVPLAGVWAYEAVRVAARRPRQGFETDHRTLPAEGGWAPAIHVAKLRGRGKPPRRLVLLHGDGLASSEPLSRHAVVTDSQGEPVGFVGTGVWHHELGPIALALVKRDVEVGAHLWVGDIAVAIDPD